MSFGALWLIVRAFFGGVFKQGLALLAKVPWKVWVVLAIVVAAWLWHASEVRATRAAGEAAGRAAVQVLLDKANNDVVDARAELLDAWTAAADAEGRDIAHAAALDRCIGTRQLMDTITRATLAHRESQRAAAVLALSAARQELDHAYATANDRCADQPVPDAVVRLLDVAAFGPPGPDAHADGRSAGAAAGARVVAVDGTDPDSAEARTTYRDLAGWIGSGWAPALSSCNADKAAIRDLVPPPER
jgi:hypothetical protein